MLSKHAAIVIGGGPAGSSAATYLSLAGCSVLLLEKEFFPRFHIGESLLPYNQRLFEEMGVLPKLQAAGFPRKFGAQFHLGNGSRSLKFVFGEGRFTQEAEAIQVERATFDQILLDHARSCGADVREGWAVQRFTSHPDHVTVHATDSAGQSRTFQGAFLIDASGRSNLTGNQEKLREVHPRLKKIAIFGHFNHVQRDDGPKAGDTVIVRLEDRWFWLIPLSPEKTSVGLVLDQNHYTRSGTTPAEAFFDTVAGSSVMRERMAAARLIGSIQCTGDFSYTNRRFAGHRLIRAGDAAGFMDPIFSAGVYLAMFSGKMAAHAVATAITQQSDGAPELNRYEKKLRRAMGRYWELVEQFYTTPFMEVFMSPRERFQIASAVNALLAGELTGNWRLHWRMRLFFWIVRAQKRWPLLPRISFASQNSSEFPTPPQATSTSHAT